MRRPSLTIGVRLLLWFLVIALTPLLVVTLLSYVTSVQTLQTSVINSLETVAFNKIQLIENFLLERKSDATTLAHLPEVVRMFQDLDALNPNSLEVNGVIGRISPFLFSYIVETDYRDL